MINRRLIKTPAIKLGQGDHATVIRKCMPLQICIQQEDARVCKRTDIALYVTSVFLGSNKHYIPIWTIEKYLKLFGVRSTVHGSPTGTSHPLRDQCLK